MSSNDSAENSPLDVIAGIIGSACALCGLVFGFREGGVGGAIAGFFLGGIGGALATYVLSVVLAIALVLAALGTFVWIVGHFIG